MPDDWDKIMAKYEADKKFRDDFMREVNAAINGVARKYNIDINLNEDKVKELGLKLGAKNRFTVIALYTAPK